MKKSEIYECAALTVIESDLVPAVKLSILEVLIADKSLALFSEMQEEQKA